MLFVAEDLNYLPGDEADELRGSFERLSGGIARLSAHIRRR